MNYQKLSTEKYWESNVRNEMKDLRREQNKRAIQSFIQFLFVLAVAFACWGALHTMPSWIPQVTEFMDANGITEGIQSFQAWLGMF